MPSSHGDGVCYPGRLILGFCGKVRKDGNDFRGHKTVTQLPIDYYQIRLGNPG